MVVDERALTDLRILVARDAELAGQAEQLRELDARVAALRSAAETVDRFVAAYPADDVARREAVRDAEAGLARRRAELGDAEAAFAQTRDDDDRAHAQRAVDRAHDHIAVAEAALTRGRETHDELDRQASALPALVLELEAEAATIGRELAGVGSPGVGPRSLVDWASRAHAELFVAVGHIDTQRERTIREVNELASMLTGEPTYGSTAVQAFARAERYWTSSPGHVSESR